MPYVHWTLNLQEAEIVAGLLGAEGIPAWVLNKGQIGVYWFHILSFGGFRVYVSPGSVARAQAVMRRWHQGDFCLPDDDDVCCPRCGSSAPHADPGFRGVAIALFWLLSGFPLWWPKRQLRCGSCGTRWKFDRTSFADLAAGAGNNLDQRPAA